MGYAHGQTFAHYLPVRDWDREALKKIVKHLEALADVGQMPDIEVTYNDDAYPGIRLYVGYDSYVQYATSFERSVLHRLEEIHVQTGQLALKPIFHDDDPWRAIL